MYLAFPKVVTPLWCLFLNFWWCFLKQWPTGPKGFLGTVSTTFGDMAKSPGTNKNNTFGSTEYFVIYRISILPFVARIRPLEILKAKLPLFYSFSMLCFGFRAWKNGPKAIGGRQIIGPQIGKLSIAKRSV